MFRFDSVSKVDNNKWIYFCSGGHTAHNAALKLCTFQSMRDKNPLDKSPVGPFLLSSLSESSFACYTAKISYFPHRIGFLKEFVFIFKCLVISY